MTSCTKSTSAPNAYSTAGRYESRPSVVSWMRCEVAHQIERRLGRAVAHPPGRHELRVRVHRDPRPHVAGLRRRGLRLRDVLLLRVDDAPDLVDLDAPAWLLTRQRGSLLAPCWLPRQNWNHMVIWDSRSVSSPMSGCLLNTTTHSRAGSHDPARVNRQGSSHLYCAERHGPAPLSAPGVAVQGCAPQWRCAPYVSRSSCCPLPFSQSPAQRWPNACIVRRSRIGGANRR